MFWAQTRIRTHFFSISERRSKPLIKTALCLSSAKITLKSRLETLILCQKSDDKRTHKHLIHSISSKLLVWILWAAGETMLGVCLVEDGWYLTLAVSLVFSNIAGWKFSNFAPTKWCMPVSDLSWPPQTSNWYRDKWLCFHFTGTLVSSVASSRKSCDTWP